MNSFGFNAGKRVFTNSFLKSKSHFGFAARLNPSSALYTSFANKLYFGQLTCFQAVSLNRLSVMNLNELISTNLDKADELDNLEKIELDSSKPVEVQRGIDDVKGLVSTIISLKTNVVKGMTCIRSEEDN